MMTAIRLIGEDHASHHGGEVLHVADENIVKVNRGTITEVHARGLIEQGRAEWVGDPPAKAESKSVRDLKAQPPTKVEPMTPHDPKPRPSAA